MQPLVYIYDMINTTKLETRLREYVWSAINMLQALCRSIVESPRRNKRILKVSLSLTIAMAFTLPPQFASFLGTNPFLLGTVVSLHPMLW